jgi:uncharacterized glyoxalase superfamily protein PhnB
MKLQKIKPMLWTLDLKHSIEFYTKVLEFHCNEVSDDWSWASLNKDEVEIILAKPNDETPFDSPSFTGSLYIQTDDVNAWWDKLKDVMMICYPIDDFEWKMREFAVYDNNGYILQFGQQIMNSEES